MSEYNFEETMSFFFDEDEDGQYSLPTEAEKKAARKKLDAEQKIINDALDAYNEAEASYYAEEPVG